MFLNMLCVFKIISKSGFKIFEISFPNSSPITVFTILLACQGLSGLITNNKFIVSNVTFSQETKPSAAPYLPCSIFHGKTYTNSLLLNG